MIRPAILAMMGAAGRGGLSVEFLQSAVDSGDLATYTFAAQPIGTASADRNIVVAIAGRQNANVELSSVTIGGVSATIDAKTPSGNLHACIASANVPTGTTADVVVTFPGALLRCGIGMWSVTGATALTANDSAVAVGASSPSSLAVDAAAGGIVIACAGDYDASSPPTYSWAGVSEDYDEVVESMYTHTGAHVSVDQSGEIVTVLTGANYNPLFASQAAVAYSGA